MLSDMARAALQAGELDKAKAYAEELLDEDAHRDLAKPVASDIHRANLVLGQLALRSGDVELATRHLLAAGSPARPRCCWSPRPS